DDNNIKESIREKAEKIYKRANIGYGRTKWDLIKNKWETEYNGLKKLFMEKIDNLVLMLPNGQYNLIWKDNIVHSFLRIEDFSLIPTILTGGMLTADPNFFGIIDFDSKPILRSKTKIDSDEIFSVPMIVIHKTETGQWGLVRSDQIHQFKKFVSGTDYYLGFEDPISGKIFSDIILNTKEGYILDGRFTLDLKDGDIQLYDRGSKWLDPYLNDARYLSKQDGVFTLLNCYRNIMYESGKHVFVFMQEITYNFVP
ncbi:unnamed protein product, partial [marine sediment metagenome]